MRVINNKVALILAVLMTNFSASSLAESPKHLFPSPAEIKKTLTLLGFKDTWQQTQGGEKLALDNGELWLRDGHYFAVMRVNDIDEQSMQRSLVNNLSICTQLGMAITGGPADTMFATFGNLTKQALVQPESAVNGGGTQFQYHVLMTELIADTPLMQCGVKRQ